MPITDIGGRTGELNSEHAARFAARLADLMAERDLSARQLAEQAGVSIGTVLVLVNGRGNPRLSTLLALVNALKLDGVELLLGELPSSRYVTRLRENTGR